MKSLLAAALTALFAVAPASPPGGGKKPAPAAPAGAADDVVAGELGQEIDAYLSSRERFKDGFSGSALVARDGAILLSKGYGIADASAKTPIGAGALWDWCSVSKQFTAAAVLKLEMQKKLAIEDPLAKHLDGVPKALAKVTIRQLLDHTSGIVPKFETFGAAESKSRDALVAWFLGGELASAPGTKWEYSNAAYFCLAALVEKKSGKPFERFLREQLWEPAGMKETFCIGEPGLDLARVPKDARGTGVPFAYGTELTWGYRGAGGVVATVGDMLAWDRALRGKKVLSEAAKKKYYAVGLNDYALGWNVKNVQGATVYSHSGRTGLVVTYYLRCVDPDVVVALAQNEEPAVHPEVTALELLARARAGAAPRGR